MALGFYSKVLLSTDKKYLFLEDDYNESDGNCSMQDLFLEYCDEGLQFELGFDSDTRYSLLPKVLLTFNTTKTENEE